ncbi:MAG: glutamyl-tRNA reductase [Micromonosporaceae bacterium]
MSALVVGLSHRTAPVSVLERIVVASDEVTSVTDRLLGSPHVGEAVVLSSCNRIEVYAGVTAFHGALNDIADLLAERAGTDRQTLADHLYVHYDAEAARHTFRVAAGLDSMVVGEPHILGQLRDSYAAATETGTAGRLLHELIQHALRTGKRVRAETGIDRAGQNMVSATLQVGADRFGSELRGRPALVVGAGAMGALSLANLHRLGAGERYVANRGAERAERLAARYDATPIGFGALPDALTEVDVVVSATASTGHVLDVPMIEAALRQRGPDRPMLLLDLALPRDIDPAAGDLAGVTLIGIEQLANAVDAVTAADLAAAELIVTEELAGHLAQLRSGAVAPTVAALRTRADELVGTELRRLAQRRPELNDEQRAEVAHTVHRVVQRLLHQPSVRVRELANEPGGTRYADALRELFGLDLDDASTAEALEAAVDAAAGRVEASVDAAGGSRTAAEVDAAAGRIAAPLEGES